MCKCNPNIRTPWCGKPGCTAPRQAKLKVFGSCNFVIDRTTDRVVIAATSQKRAAELLGVSLYDFKQFWSETGNEEEIKAAMAKPETILISRRSVIVVFEEYIKRN